MAFWACAVAGAAPARAGDIQLRMGSFSAEGYDVWEPSRKAGYSRVYCSDAPASWLGPGWKGDWDEKLVFPAKGQAQGQARAGAIVWHGFLCGDGIRFVPDPFRGGHYRGDLSSQQQLRRVGDGYELELEGLTVLFDSQGRKTRWWMRRGGPYFEIVRSESGAPKEVRFGGETLMRVVTEGKRIVRLDAGKAAGGASVGRAVPFEYDFQGRLVRVVSAIGRIHNYSYGKGDRLTSVIEDGPGGDPVDERLEWGGGPVRGAWAVRVRRDLASGREERLLYAPSDGRRWKTAVRVLREGSARAIGTATFEWETVRSPAGSLSARVVRNSVNGDRVEGSFAPGQAVPVAVRYGDLRRELRDLGPETSFDQAHLPPWLFPRWLKAEHLAARIWADAILRIEIVDAQGRTRGTGSGFFISPDGVVATNFHVMEEVALGRGGARPRFVLPNGRILEKYQVGHCQKSSRTDLCVLKLDHYPSRYFDPRLGRSPPAEGTEIFSVGNAESRMMPAIRGIFRGSFGFRNAGWIEVSNEILPGDSGGPIFTWDGRLVGMSTIILFTVPRPERQGGKQVHRDDTRLAMSAAEVSRVDELSPTFKSPERVFGGR